MRTPARISAPCALGVAIWVAGCAGPTWVDETNPREPTAVIDLNNYRAFSIEGVAVDPDSGDLHAFLNGQGILVLERDGTALDAIPSASSPLLQNGVVDLAVLPGGDYLVESSTGIVRAPADTLEEEERYELEALGNGSAADWRSYDALAYDPSQEEILCVSTEWDWDRPDDGRMGNEVSTFTRGGELRDDSVMLAPDTEMFIQGLARHPTEDLLLGVDQGWLMVYGLDGEALVRFTLDQVSAASALAVDAERGLVHVGDRTDLEIVSFALEDFDLPSAR